MLKKFLGVAAAAVLAVGGLVVAPQAHADGEAQPVGTTIKAPLSASSLSPALNAAKLSPMGAILCGDTSRCGLRTPINVNGNAFREGGPMPINVYGAKGKTVQVRAFAVIRDEANTKYVNATPVSNAVSATPTGAASDTYGDARVDVTIGKFPAPFNGAEVIVQPADWKISNLLVPADTRADEPEVFWTEVLSSRGRDMGFAEQRFTDIFHRKVDAAIPGESYSVQFLRNGKWVTIDNNGPGKVGPLGTASIQAKVPADLPTGKYRTRLVNNTKKISDLSPDADYTYFTWTRDATPPKPTDPGFNVYTTPGLWDYNGRKWKTSCEAYSATERCRTEIWATQILYSAGQFNRVDGWAFNNLTYKPSPRSLWKGNPVGGNGTVSYQGEWTATDGRKWRVECDTATTGRNGCRAYAMAKVAEPVSAGASTYHVVDKWLFNNIVQFS